MDCERRENSVNSVSIDGLIVGEESWIQRSMGRYSYRKRGADSASRVVTCIYVIISTYTQGMPPISSISGLLLESTSKHIDEMKEKAKRGASGCLYTLST